MRCIVLQETYLCHCLHYIYAVLFCLIHFNVYYMNGEKTLIVVLCGEGELTHILLTHYTQPSDTSTHVHINI